MPDTNLLIGSLVVGIFALSGGVFTIYKFITMILDRRDAKIFRELKRIEIAMSNKADKSEVANAVDKIATLVGSMQAAQTEFVTRMDKHVEIFYSSDHKHEKELHLLDRELAVLKAKQAKAG